MHTTGLSTAVPDTEGRGRMRALVDKALSAAPAMLSHLLDTDAYHGITLTRPEGPIRESGIVLLIYPKDGELFVIGIRRPESMRAFPGHIVYPGGKLEHGEPPVKGALRELGEELGVVLGPETVAGSLPPIYVTGSLSGAYAVHPHIVVMDSLPVTKPNPAEAEKVIELSLAKGRSGPPITGATKFIFDAVRESLALASGKVRLCELDRPLPERSQHPLSLIVTSGGTIVPIDTVRSITNGSMGTTGAAIAERALCGGNTVRYLHSRGARTPFQKELTLDPRQPLGEELRRIDRDARRIVPLLENLEAEQVGTFDDYRRRLLELVTQPECQAVIVAMAASDYGPPPVEGKISSDKDSLVINLTALPKIIAEIKKERRDIFLVGFKLLQNEPPDVLIAKAYRNMLRDKQDLAVANVGANTMNPGQLLTYIVTLERGVRAVPRNELPDVLMQMIEDRHSTRHFSTKVKKVDELPVSPEDLHGFITDLHDTARLALFNSYEQSSRAEFGFVAKRTAGGTLITTRGSSKSSATVDDVCLVTGVDTERRLVEVASTGHKASLNASLAHLIMERRPDVNYIVHAHIPLPGSAVVPRDTAPGTMEDWEGVQPLVEAGHTVIEQPNHGVIILLKDLDDLVPLLEAKNIYRTHAEHYDAAYRRFIKSDRLLDILDRTVPRNAAVLDLAAGTGEVSRELLSRGYADLTLADPSRPMLDVAWGKLGHLVARERFVRTSIQDLPYRERFDAVLVRQAINYLPPAELAAGLARIRAALKPGGTLIFNSFDPRDAEKHPVRDSRYDNGQRVLVTHEANRIDGKKVYHGQRTELFDTVTGDYQLFYDLNGFWMYSADEFERAATEAGFKKVSVERNGHSLYFSCEV